MKALFILDTEFPYGKASSSRARNFIKLFNECGYKIHIMAHLNGEKIDDLEYTCENINIFKNYRSLLGIRTAVPVEKMLKNYLRNNKIDLIFSNNIPYVVPRILRIASENKIPYILEQCEWYDSSSFKLGKYNPYYIECMKMIEYKNKNLDGIIAISRLLEKHYLNQGVKTIRIPTILDMNNILPRYVRKNKKKLNIVFAGSLGKGKENIYPMLKAVEYINKSIEKIHLHFYGPTKEQIRENINFDKILRKSYIHIYGRIPQPEIENKVREADFTFIIRPNRKSSNAGFPTKLVESMSVGTPVIANDTGDIGMYIKDRENGFLLSKNTDEELIECLQYILKMNDHNFETMRRNARRTCDENFDYRKYIDPVRELIRSLK